MMALPSHLQFQAPGAKFLAISTFTFTSTSSSSRIHPRPHPLLPRALRFHLYTRPFSSLAVASSTPFSSSVDAPDFTSTVGPPAPALPLQHWNLGPRHIILLNITACVVALSSAWLFLSAIPTILAFRKTLESVEKLLELTADELPDTMASLRLSSMEITDLTTQLTDLGEELTEGVRSSTRPLRVAEERFRQLAAMTPKVMVQGQNGLMENTKRPTPPVAKAARELREGISRGRQTFEMINSVVGFSRWVFRGGKKKQK